MTEVFNRSYALCSMASNATAAWQGDGLLDHPEAIVIPITKIKSCTFWHFCHFVLLYFAPPI
jgi:hypothetical protein